jgi:hypothetical protein
MNQNNNATTLIQAFTDLGNRIQIRNNIPMPIFKGGM